MRREGGSPTHEEGEDVYRSRVLKVALKVENLPFLPPECKPAITDNPLSRLRQGGITSHSSAQQRERERRSRQWHRQFRLQRHQLSSAQPGRHHFIPIHKAHTQTHRHSLFHSHTATLHRESIKLTQLTFLLLVLQVNLN